VGETLGDRNDALRQLLTVFLIAGPAGVALASLAGWLLAGAALRPVERMRRRAAELSHADTRARLPVPRTGDELTRLATTLNDLLDRLHGALEREHRFVDDASHELRTPLAILKAELDLSMARPRTPAELQATVTSAARETDHLVRLAEDMLVLARVRAGSLPLRAETVHLPDLLRDAVAPMRPRAEELGTSVDVDTADSTVDVDPVRIRQAVQNLVDNALRHGSGPVAVAARTSAEGLRITVTDQGPGVPSDLLGTAFEPFTRGPVRSHGRPAGSADSDGTYRGAGLGLAIVRSGGRGTRRHRDPGRAQPIARLDGAGGVHSHRPPAPPSRRRRVSGLIRRPGGTRRAGPQRAAVTRGRPPRRRRGTAFPQTS
jgi:signal transduction histidine kinase